MHVIGTAGHVDHGKSTLVHALTGIDPDRLEEEKRRGLTIDLGFAWLRLASGREVGIVDVPGHERFIKNMLAGVGAINVTMFVVAANEGWKPQSQEHLDILDLLGVRAAVFVITKKDTVDPAKLSAAVQDVSQRIARTTMKDAPILTVSALTGEGIPELIVALDALLEASPPAPDRGRPRLWIDRVFSMHGSGTVVTGTLIEGGLHQNQEIEILPQGLRARIRTIQSHRRQVEEIGPGNRTALNLVGLETAELARGDVIASPGCFLPSRRVAASLRFLPSLDHEPTEKGAFKFYVGSAERDARIRFITARGHEGLYALIDLDSPAIVDWGDRFVIRDAGRRETLGGGLILEPHAMDFRTSSAGDRIAKRISNDRSHYAAAVLEDLNFLPRNQFLVRTGISEAEAKSTVPAVWTDNFAIDRDFFDDIESNLREATQRHHLKNPLEPGMSLSTARNLVPIDTRLFDDLLEEIRKKGSLEIENGVIRILGFAPSVAGPDYDRLLRVLEEAGAAPPTTSELRQNFDPALVRAAVREGAAVQVSQDLIFSSTWFESLKTAIRALVSDRGPFTVAEFRDLIGTTRKYAVPLLEHLDAEGFTRRSGDQRVLGPRA